MRYFNGKAGDMYHNKTTGFRSYFIEFEGGTRLEVMTAPDVSDVPKGLRSLGYSHIAMSMGSRENVDRLTKQLQSDGFEVISGPRVTGDGYYESCVVCIEGIMIELTV